MGLDDRQELFGQPTDSGAAEAVWRYRRHHDDWPSFEEAILWIADWDEVAGDQEEAERRLLEAYRNGEVLLKLGDDGTWLITLSDEMADRIARRYMDVTMKRKDREDSW